MGIPQRIITIIMSMALETTAHSFICNSTQNLCNEHQHWAGASKEKPQEQAKLQSHTQSWFLASFKEAQLHLFIETQAKSEMKHLLNKEIFLKTETHDKKKSIIVGEFTHPLQILKHPIFSIYNHDVENKFQPPRGKGLWLTFDDHTSSLLEISATSNHTYGIRYSYDTHYLNSTRFSLAHIYSKNQKQYSISMLSPGFQGSFFLIEVTRLEEKLLPFKQIIRISYKESYENHHRKFIQYDDILHSERRLIYGVDFDISKTKHDLHFTVFQEYRNPKNTSWFWAIHTGIGGII